MRRAFLTRRRLGLIAAVTAALAAAACSEPPTTGSGNAVQIGPGAELPDCPLGVLDEAKGPVEVNLWYGGLVGSTKATMEDIVARFNASQDR
ncbi:MAG: hypothetical protein EHM13_13090, partial [Acidobacteria bacterium]